MSRWTRWLLCGSLCVVMAVAVACKKDEEEAGYDTTESTELSTEYAPPETTETTEMTTDMGTELGTEMPAPTPP